MIARILAHFPPHTHPLTLASDPDELLSGESLLVELAARGFRILKENDPVMLRYQVEAARPFTPENPLLVITPGALNELPYDLWQQAHHVRLDLHQFFPTLSYPVLKTLNPEQLERLAARHPHPERSAERQGRLATLDALLRTVFEFDPQTSAQPHHLIAWLIRLHDQLGPLPEPFVERVADRLRQQPQYRDWDFPALLRDREAVSAFVQTEWQGFLRAPAQEAVRETRLPFHEDEGLQNLLPSLVRKGLLVPESAERADLIPDWARVAVADKEDGSRERLVFLLAPLAELFDGFSTPTRWPDWQEAAGLWAEINALRHEPGLAAEERFTDQIAALAQKLDRAFAAWLKDHYAPLGTQRLPVPRHVFHLPHYLAYLREQQQARRVALLVLDGMSLCDWMVVRSAWAVHHHEWHFTENTVLAQIPTITSISRRSLISGLRPADFAADLDHMPAEKDLWSGFWLRAGLPREAVFYSTISLDRQAYPPEVEGSRLTALCLVDDTLDQLVHHSVLGTAGQQAALRLWLERGRAGNSEPLERLISLLLARGFLVFITSDHGHVEAVGMGAPSEGILAQTRGRRARLYQERLTAQRTLDLFPDSILWNNDGLLPDTLSALMPAGRSAFTTKGETVVTHGGISLDELVVPFIQISKS